MWVVMSFFLAATIGVVAVLAVGRRGLAQSHHYPWILHDTAKMHAGITAGLAGFALTGVVLVVTLAHDRPAIGGEFPRYRHRDVLGGLPLVGRQRLFGLLHTGYQNERRVGAARPFQSFLDDRISYGLSAWFALLPLLEANGLGHLSYVLYFLLPASLLCGSVIIAMVADSLGLLRVWETYFSAGVGSILALGYTAIVAFAVPGARSQYSTR